MFEKKARFNIHAEDIQALSVPDLTDSVLIDQNLKVSESIIQETILKIANSREALTKEVESPEIKTDDEIYFDLEAEIKSHPDSLYVKCFAIKADEMNDNGDWFGQSQLKEATPTFVGVPVFTNHQNSDVEKARGRVVHSWWEDDRNGIMIIARVDAEAYPQLARGIKEDYILGTSMGCQVQYSLCSVCHNYAETPDQYCEHIRERKTRNVTSAKQKCTYHKRGEGEVCPVCSSKKGDTHTFKYDGKSFEYNFGIKFIENSFVVNPACHDCGVTEIIDTSRFVSKVAEIQRLLPGLLKAASEANPTFVCSDDSCTNALTRKTAGQKEINDLNDAINLITSVSQAMLSQKDQLDLEFLSDLVKVLADLQTVVDELLQQGYGRLQSPDEAGDPSNPSDPSQAAPQQQQGIPGMQAVNPTPGGGSKVNTGPAGSVGTVTGPQAEKKIDLEKVAFTLARRVETLASNESLDLPKKLLIKYMIN